MPTLPCPLEAQARVSVEEGKDFTTSESWGAHSVSTSPWKRLPGPWGLAPSSHLLGNPGLHRGAHPGWWRPETHWEGVRIRRPGVAPGGSIALEAWEVPRAGTGR